MSPVEPLLEVRGLDVTLGGQPILQDVSFAVQPGTIHALLGPNGGGKTTLIRAILGDVPCSGSIELNFVDAGCVGYVPQSLQFDASLPITVSDLLVMMLRRKPVFAGRFHSTRREIQALLAQTESAHLLDRRIGKLSGGELRRVLLAQSLAPRPELLLLDEPASNVDPQGSRLLEAILGRLRDEGITILMVDHDVPMVLRLASRVTGINGTVSFDGPAADLGDAARLDRLYLTPRAAPSR